MRNMRKWIYILLAGLLLVPLALLCKACAGTETGTRDQVQQIEPVAVEAPTWVDAAKKQGFATHGQYIAAQAIAMATSLYGPQKNMYYADDSTLAPAIAYWQRTCKNTDGSLCSAAQSGNLQCVEFVAAIFAALDDELPYIGDANQFWAHYQEQPGWQEIPTSALGTRAPTLGDIVTWSGGKTGHLALIVDLQPPMHGQDGYITVTQSDASDTFDQLTWHTNGHIDSWSGYTLQGFIHQQEIAPCLQLQATPTQLHWETLAAQAAVHYGIPSKYFLRQLCQSGFQATDSAGQVITNPTGASGIAQLPSKVAAQTPRCTINIVNNAPNCAQMPGSLPSGKGIDPTKPEEALPAAASVMSMLYEHYLQNMQAPQDGFRAYTMALAAYNAGTDTVDKAVKSCGKQQWLSCLDRMQPDHHTRNYVDTILGITT